MGVGAVQKLYHAPVGGSENALFDLIFNWRMGGGSEKAQNCVI